MFRPGAFWNGRKHHLDKMTLRDLVHAYFAYPAIQVYLALGTASAVAALWWDHSAMSLLVAAAFGPDRMQKTVYKLREGARPIRELCFVALDEKGKLVASLRFWPIVINEQWPAVLLGPLAVAPELRGLGYGKALMRHGIEQARAQGHKVIVLVGDPEYYNPFGFTREQALTLALPGPVEERRFLALGLVPGALDGVSGMIGKRPAAVAAKKRKRA